MARVNKGIITNTFADDLGLSTAVDKVPNTIREDIQPVVDIMPKFSTIYFYGNNNATGAVTVLTAANNNRQFYITSIQAAVTKNIACDNVGVYLNVDLVDMPNGAGMPIVNFPLQTLTAESQQIFVSYMYPLKVRKNSIITLNGSFGVGALTKSVVITGFYTE